MLEALTYQEMLRNIIENSERYGIEDGIIGILFTRPNLQTGEAILSSLDYYHFRTGKTVDFYLPGYGAYWYGSYPDEKVVAKIDGVEWSFSTEMLVKFVEDVEKYSKWDYKGESELLLVPYVKKRISYDKMMIFHLDQMLRDKVIVSIDSFFEKLFKLCKSKETLNEISNVFEIDKAKQIAMEGILNKIPGGLKEVFIQEKYFCVRNAEK